MPRISTTKATFNKGDPFHHRIGLKLRKKPVKFYIWNTVSFSVFKFRHFGKWIRNT